MLKYLHWIVQDITTLLAKGVFFLSVITILGSGKQQIIIQDFFNCGETFHFGNLLILETFHFGNLTCPFSHWAEVHVEEGFTLENI